MKIALITDLHANREAVTAVMAHSRSQGAQRYAFLGDFVGYGADPAWVVDLVHEHVDGGAVAVMGNHDAAVVQGALPSMVPEARQVVEWTRAQLSKAQLDFLATLPYQVREGDTLFVHANAWAPKEWAYIMGRADAVRSIYAADARFTFCGHMHEPRLFHMSAVGKTSDFTPVSGAPIPLLGTRRWLVIPGSRGQPRDGDPAACYAVYDDASSELTYWRVPYDTEGAGAKIRAAQLPQRLVVEELVVRDDLAAQVEALAEATFTRFGVPSFVFNNAGVASGGLVWEHSVADWNWVLGVNLWGVIHGVRVFTPMMLAAAKADANLALPDNTWVCADLAEAVQRIIASPHSG